MNWIKKRYDQFLLALLAVVLLVCAVLIFLRVQSFGEKFSDAMANVPPNNKVPPVELDRIDEPRRSCKTRRRGRTRWTKTGIRPAAPCSFPSITSSARKARPKNRPKDRFTRTPDRQAHPEQMVPGQWAALADRRRRPAGSGQGRLHQRGRMARPHRSEQQRIAPALRTPSSSSSSFEKVPFRLVFKSYDGDPKKDKIGEIQLPDRDHRHAATQRIPARWASRCRTRNSSSRSFEFKEAYNDKIQEKEDVSELTLVDTETGDKIVLIYNKVIDSPTSMPISSTNGRSRPR